MTISERELEEDEAKIDNILHKILMASEQIVALTNEIGVNPGKNTMLKEKFHILSGTISNLALLADEITLHDEVITDEIEKKIRSELGSAIGKISEIKEMFEQQKNNE